MSLVLGDYASGTSRTAYYYVRRIGSSPGCCSGHPWTYDVIERGVLTTTAASVSTIIGYAGDIVTEAYTWVTETVTLISGSPLILTFVLVSFVGLGVGLIRRMIKL